ncbi:MAG TPA: small basic protein [Phycisphaerales bacterium]|mgnify:CR=1 FL=1|nr:small basic protein [Phycisphaerales bacterium]|tara:strand:+ start:5409 stop:5669 length:261 start_codon:yes stop_codon:yes gene_type:complete
MSLHRSLKTKPAGLNQHRNVLKRSERVEKLAEKGEFDFENDSPIGLVKVANRAVVTKKPKKEQTEETTEGAEGGEGTEGEAAAETE